MAALIVILVLLVIAGAITASRSIKIVQQFEQGIVFRFGRIEAKPRGPGIAVIRPVGDRMQKVNMQIVAMAVPAQEGITRDNVSVRVDAVVYFRVVDPVKAVINVQNYLFAISQQAQTSLRSIIGQSEMDQLLAERATVNKELRRVMDEPAGGPCGQPEGPGPPGPAAPAAADRGRGRGGAQQHAGHADPGRAAEVLRQV